MNTMTTVDLNEHTLRFYDDATGKETLYARDKIIVLTSDGMEIIVGLGMFSATFTPNRMYLTTPTDIADIQQEVDLVMGAFSLGLTSAKFQTGRR